MRLTTSVLFSCVATAFAFPQGGYGGYGPTVGPIKNLTIWTPPSNYTDPRVLYARSVLLSNGDLLATWENYSPEPPKVYFPIWRSRDAGRTWKEISRVQDTKNNYGLRYQPDLYLLPQRIGKFPAGTLLCSGSSIPTDLSSTELQVHASRDSGLTWEYVSSFVSGGVAIPNNGETPVWEPFLLARKGKVIAFYSTQADPKYGQKLSHKTSTNLVNWSDEVDDVTHPVYTARPGMTTVAKLPDGNYIQTYEYGGGPGNNGSYWFPVYYRLSKDPEKFLSAPDHPLVTKDGVTPTGSPYVVWTPYGGQHGTIIASAGGQTEVFANRALGAEDAWEKLSIGVEKSYTRHLRVMPNPRYLLVLGGGKLPPSTTNRINLNVIDLKEYLG